ncbi:DUF1080 domain-containing protein [Mariniflexile ostreae]|uniref:DUF1080 domain-containing protein n=1 Tax=Mariniflexile ostreae TaxID=1520892 RepID=A0ABV5FAA3_9FLAO
MMQHLKKTLTIISCLTLLLSCKDKDHRTTSTPAKTQWVKLFNGKNLENWIVKIKGYPAGENYKNTFIVEDGSIKVNYDEYEDRFNNTFGHLFYNQEFSNYKLRLEYRFTGKPLSDGAGWAAANSGVMIHSENPENMGLEQNFPVSIEVQLLGGLGIDDRSTGNVCTPGTHISINGKQTTEHCISSNSKTFHGNQWVRLEIEVLNDFLISHKINGEEVMLYSKPVIGGDVDANHDYWKARAGSPLKKGYISLQSESQSTEFKNIEILEL